MSGNLLERFRVITGVAPSKNNVPEYEWSILEETVQYQTNNQCKVQSLTSNIEWSTVY